MAVKKVKKDLEILVIQDSREKLTEYGKDLIDSRIGKDGIKIVSVVKECVKAFSPITNDIVKTSSGDLTFWYREKDSNAEWIKSSFVIEIKQKNDIFSSNYLKANRDRLYSEILRCKNDGLYLNFLVTDDLTVTTNRLNKIAKFKNTNVENSHFENMILLNQELVKNGFEPFITTGTNLAWSIRRCIKRYIIKNKLQYL